MGKKLGFYNLPLLTLFTPISHGMCQEHGLHLPRGRGQLVKPCPLLWLSGEYRSMPSMGDVAGGTEVCVSVHVSKAKSVLTAVPQVGPACCRWAGHILLPPGDIPEV